MLRTQLAQVDFRHALSSLTAPTANATLTHDEVRTTLDDKYIQTGGRVFISSNQALVRLPLDQKRRDRAAGLNTAGYISGYRGSPLGVYDSALWAAQKLLDSHDIRFMPGPERGARRQRDSRHATAEVVRQIELRRRLRPVVRQGHRRRSRLRIVEARQSRRHVRARRLSRRGGRRSRRQVLR